MKSSLFLLNVRQRPLALVVTVVAIVLLPGFSASAELLSQIDVFVGGGEGPQGSAIFRLPSTVITQDGSMLTFAEARENGQDPGNSTVPIKMVMKRSTDNGATWSSLVVIHSEPAFDLSDPRAAIDAKTGTVYLLYAQWPHGSKGTVPAGLGKDSTRIILQSSKDNGKTWSGPMNITAQVKDPTWRALNNAGPGAAIQLRWQTKPARNGRLVIPAWRGNASGTRNNLSFYSDDGGVTWHSGSPVKGAANEAAIVELSDGRLLMSIRTPKVRLHSHSSDGGQTWGPVFNSDIAMTAVHAAFQRYSAQRGGDDRDRILFSGPLGDPIGSAKGRQNLGIWTSYDEGKTFINPVQVDSGYGGYSVMQKLNNGTVGLLFEMDRAHSIQHIRADIATLEGMQHQVSLTHYEGFSNKVDRTRGGVGWSGSWQGNGRFTCKNEPAFRGASSVPFSGLRFDTGSGRIDLSKVGGCEVSRKLAAPVRLDQNLTTYISLVISQALDGTTDDAKDEFFRVDLRDAQGITQASFGVKSDESFFVDTLGGAVTTSPDTLQRSKSYFLVSKIVSQRNGESSDFDQIFLKVFESGVDAIPEADDELLWTLVGTTSENSSALINTIAIVGGQLATWSIDELRVGTSFGAVASNRPK